MCGRYTLTAANPADIRTRFPVGESIEIHRRYNVAPGDDVLALTTDRDGEPRGEMLRWGLVPSWAQSPETGPKMINARVETVAQRPAFRAAFERMRCLIIADGFYEWRLTPGGGSKQPFHITRADGRLFVFAGLWSIWHSGRVGKQSVDDEALRSCTILTTAANAAIAELHDRMPVILAPEAESAWLDLSTSAEHLRAILSGLGPSQTALRPVDSAVNDARCDGPACLASPVPREETNGARALRGGQATLF
ncbi:MAG: SOS response-associated peptidase [Solirubrobacteraceae bacterium]